MMIRQVGRATSTTQSLISLAALALSGAPWHSASAQQGSVSDGDDSQIIAEIVVTAQKRSQSINDVGMSISALGAQELDRRGIQSAQDLASIVPGFTYTQTQFDMPVFSIRGVGYLESSMSANPAVSLYVDEVPLTYPAMQRGDLLDVQRVEVLKGPQGTLFGQNSTGGAINYIATKPTDEFAAGLTGSVDRFGGTDLEGFINGPLGQSVRTRFAARADYGGAWQENQVRDTELGRAKEIQARLLTDWNATETLTVRLNVNGWIDRSQAQAPQLRALYQASPQSPLDPEVAASPRAIRNARQANWDTGRDYERDNSFYQAALRGDWETPSGATLTSISAYQHFDRDQFAEADGTAFEDIMVSGGGHISSFFQELRLAGEAERLQSWIVGANFQDDTIVDRTQVELDRYSLSNVNLGGFGSFHFSEYMVDTRSEVRSWGVFASAELALSEQVSLEAGARYSDTRNSFDGCSGDTGNGEIASLVSGPGFNGMQGTQALFSFLDRTFAGGNPQPTSFATPGACALIINQVLGVGSDFNVGGVSDELEENNVSWRANLNWHPNDAALLYANVSRGFKAGNFPALGGTVDTQFAPATQEQLTAYETGFKLSLVEQLLQLNGAVFYYDYQDKQLRGRVPDPLVGNLEKLVNIPESHVQGAELQLAWLNRSGLSASIGASYIETRIDGRFSNFTNFGEQVELGGNEFPYAPSLQANADVEYRTQSAWSGVHWFVGAAANYRDETKGGLEDADQQPLGFALQIDGYTLVDVWAGLEADDGKWRVTLWGRNVTDEYYDVALIKAGDSVVGYAGHPLTYGATASVRF